MKPKHRHSLRNGVSPMGAVCTILDKIILVAAGLFSWGLGGVATGDEWAPGGAWALRPPDELFFPDRRGLYAAESGVAGVGVALDFVRNCVRANIDPTIRLRRPNTGGDQPRSAAFFRERGARYGVSAGRTVRRDAPSNRHGSAVATATAAFSPKDYHC
jgi:hypothetical protein